MSGHKIIQGLKEAIALARVRAGAEDEDALKAAKWIIQKWDSGAPAGTAWVLNAVQVARAFIALHARCRDAQEATVSEGEEQGFGAPATKERPSSPSLERVAVLEKALHDIEGKCADTIAGRINYRAGDLQSIARAALKAQSDG